MEKKRARQVYKENREGTLDQDTALMGFLLMCVYLGNVKSAPKLKVYQFHKFLEQCQAYIMDNKLMVRDIETVARKVRPNHLNKDALRSMFKSVMGRLPTKHPKEYRVMLREMPATHRTMFRQLEELVDAPITQTQFGEIKEFIDTWFAI